MDKIYGRHLRVKRGAYWHHAIGIGNGQVIHFTGVASSKAAARVQRDDLQTFASGGRVEVVAYARCFAPNAVVQRAMSLEGLNGYNVVGNNCEHVARWCMTSEHRSPQVEKAGGSTLGVGGTAATAAATAMGTVSLASAAGTKGGAAVMSAVKSVGKPFGGGVRTGVVAMAALPAAVANVAINKALPDDPNLPPAERSARSTARATTAVTSVLGGMGSIGAVALAGVEGLSAVGVATGLAEIGALVGGGMVAGAAIVIAVPAALAFLAGLIAYAAKAPPRPQLVVEDLLTFDVDHPTTKQRRGR